VAQFSGPIPPEAAAILIPTNIPKVKGFTVEAFVRTGCYRESDWRGRVSKEVEGRMEEALKMLGIEELRKRDISTLSDGEFQKACLATGLTRKAEVLLLDEPTAHLDVENRIDVLRTLREVARKTGTAVLFSSHDLHDALQVADRVFALTRDGRFLASGPFDKFRDPDAVLRAAFPALANLL
jgi:iron complex transport system ATP-binding protein